MKAFKEIFLIICSAGSFVGSIGCTMEMVKNNTLSGAVLASFSALAFLFMYGEYLKSINHE